MCIYGWSSFQLKCVSIYRDVESYYNALLVLLSSVIQLCKRRVPVIGTFKTAMWPKDPK